MTGPAGGGLVPLTDAEVKRLRSHDGEHFAEVDGDLLVRLLAERDVLRRLVRQGVDGDLDNSLAGPLVWDDDAEGLIPLASVDPDGARVLAAILDQPCHADVLLDLANRPRREGDADR